MEVRKGYKQTEIGVIPSDWEVTTFEKIADKTKKWSITGGPFGSNLKTSDYTNDGVQIIQLQNIGDGTFINESQVYTSKEKANQLLSCNIYPGEIILSKMGDPVARCCFIPNSAERFLMASDGIKLIVDEKKFNKRFVYEYINSKYFRLRAFDISTGSTRLRIGLPNLKSLSFIKPTLKEQNAIATALSDADYWINSLERLLAKKRQIKVGAMQELLQTKEGWEVKKLGEIGDCIIGLTYRPNNVSSEGTLVLRSSNVTGNKLVYEDTVFVDLEISEKQTTRKGDILICVRNGSRNLIGKCAYIDGRGIGETFGAFMSVFRSNYNDYIFHVFQSNIIKKQIDEHLGATINQITNKSLNSFEIPFPSKKEQTRIAKILSDMDEEITQLETKLDKAKQIKQGMMQELLTGRTRLV